MRDHLGHRVDHRGSGGARRVFVVGGEWGDFFREIERHRQRHAGGEFCGEFLIRGGPCVVCLLPSFELDLGSHLFLGEKCLRFLGNKEMFVGRKPETGAGGVDEFRPTFAVALGGAGDFGDAFADQRAGDDHLRTAVFVSLGSFNRSSDGGDVLTVDSDRVPALRGEILLRVLALSEHRHGI